MGAAEVKNKLKMCKISLRILYCIIFRYGACEYGGYKI